jgi:hypothetical protein
LDDFSFKNLEDEADENMLALCKEGDSNYLFKAKLV